MIEKIAYLLLTLFITIFLHEIGHYLAGVLFHVRMKSFNIFWGPGFKLFSSHKKWFLKLFPSCKNKIEVTIGWIPLLAYVQFCDSDEVEDKRMCISNKHAWQKFIIFSAGLLFNLLTIFSVHSYMVTKVLEEKSPLKVVALASKFTVQDVGMMMETFKNDAISYCKQLGGVENTALTRPQQEENNVSKGALYKSVEKYHAIWDFENFIIQISRWAVVLFCLNIIPIPPLDGGKMLFSGYEMITQRKISENIQMWINGIVFMLFIIYTVYDIIREVVLDFLYFIH